MKKKKIRATTNRSTPPNHERKTFLILVILVMGLVALGMLQYTGLLILGSVIFVGFFGWLWWTRRTAAAASNKKVTKQKKSPAPRQRKPGKRRRTT